ncbi:MAG: hypothetical protein J0L62_03155 [Bacteroidetes bacterium]|nr:hypothetical protein [Bacteroidota bacterium]
MKTRFIFPVLFLIFFSFGSFTSCKEPESTGPENRTDSLTLKVKETDLTSATLYLHTAGITYPASLTLTRNSQPVQTFSLHQPDTTLIDTALTPSTSYTWQTTWKKTETTFLKGEPVTDRTMDTTSHEFTWKLDTLGCSGSNLLDVAIVNDTCVWVVGDMTTAPRGGVTLYNAAMYNGKIWKKFAFSLPLWPSGSRPQIIRCIWFDGENLWVFSEIGGYAKIKPDGKVLKTGYCLERRGTPQKMWGNQKNQFYLAGSDGSMTWYDGSAFHLIETGTQVDFLDIWGTPSGEVWACGYVSRTGIGVLVRKNGAQFEVVYETGKPSVFNGYDWITSAIWSPDNKNIWVNSGARIIVQPIDQIQNVTIFPRNAVYGFFQYQINGMRGTGINDVFFAGVLGVLWHYNGSTFKKYPIANMNTTWLTSIAVSKHQVFAVGYGFGEGQGSLIWSLKR